VEAHRRGEERLEATVQELVEAHRRGEERLARLEATVQELVEAAATRGAVASRTAWPAWKPPSGNWWRFSGDTRSGWPRWRTAWPAWKPPSGNWWRPSGDTRSGWPRWRTAWPAWKPPSRNWWRRTGDTRRGEDRLARLEATVQELVEVQRQHEERLASVEERLASAEDRLARLEATVQELVGALKEVSAQVHELAQAVFRLTQTVSRLEGTVGDIKGRLLEMAYRDKPYAYFGRLLRSIRVVPFTEIEDLLEKSLSREEVDDLFQLDLLLRGRLRDHPERPEVWLAVEVSSVVDKWDVERARERAALLRKAGLRVVPVAAGLQALAEAAHKAEVEGVTLVTDGSIACWEQALRSALV
jgi:cell division septum initiation protein DivIVA